MNGLDLQENYLVALKKEAEDFAVEFEVVPYKSAFKSDDSRRKKINAEISEIDNIIAERQSEIDKINEEIERLTNHADKLDYTIAVASGVLCGLIDSFVVGEWDFKNAKAISNKKANEKVMEFAKKNGFEGDRLDKAVEFLEKKFKLPGDGAYKLDKAGFGITDKSHHLDDFCHHPTLVGLICCVIVQFTGSTIYVNSTGDLINIPITVNEYGKFVGKNPVTKFFAGLINWFFNVAQTAANAKGHWISDIAGSHSSAGKGMGLPGPFMSTLKELSALPCFKDKNFGENLRKAFQNGIGTGKKQIDLGVFNNLFEGASSKFDSRTEDAIKHELGRQSVPIIINEVIVRGFYFVRRFTMEMKNVDSIKDISWKNVLPLKNRTIVRMMTIASGTFCAVDMADAAIRSAIKSKGESAAFWANFILRVNFVGIGRFAIAIGADVGMGIKRSRKRDERIKLMNEVCHLENAKVFYLQANMWISAEEAGKVIDEAYKAAEMAANYFIESFYEIESDLDKIGDDIDKAEENNPGLKNEVLDILKWG